MTDHQRDSDAPTQEAYENTGRASQSLLIQRRYKELDDELLSLNPTGLADDHQWRVSAAVDLLGSVDHEFRENLLYRGASLILPNLLDFVWRRRAGILNDWLSQSRSRVAPSVCLAQLNFRHAWIARGNGYARSVTTLGWEKFHDRISMASELLDSTEHCAESFLPWFPLKLCVSKVDGSDRSVWYQTFERGVQANPTFWSTYTDRKSVV